MVMKRAAKVISRSRWLDLSFVYGNKPFLPNSPFQKCNLQESKVTMSLEMVVQKRSILVDFFIFFF